MTLICWDNRVLGMHRCGLAIARPSTCAGMPTTGVVTATTFFLEGCGVHQRSIGASVLVCLLYLANLLAGIVPGSVGNPSLQLIVLMLLFANVRATVISSRWMSRPVDAIDQELPEREIDRSSNRLPATLWPGSRYVFFPMATILLLLMVIGTVLMKRQITTRKNIAPTSTQELEVSPR